MPKISVVIPAYNAEKTILETIQSVQQQTFNDFELIVINDGSKDETIKKLNTIKDERLKIFSYENGGLPTARNRGISHATGEFISFIDADDLWTPDKLELQLAALEKHPETGVAYSWTICMIETEKSVSFVKSASIFFEGNVYNKLLLENFIGSGSNILVRRQAIESTGEFEPTLKSCEDWDFYLRLATSWPFVVIPKNQIIYRKAPGSMTSKAKVMEKEALRVIKKAYQTAPLELQYLKNQSLANLYRYCADLYLTYSTDISEVRQAQRKLWLAIQLNPKILLTRDAQKLSIKLLLKQLLPEKLVGYIIRPIKKLFDVRDPRLQP
jgi:glycosyltransferase involved in cell wall biosynthesis